MTKPWLNKYPKGVPENIEMDGYQNVSEIAFKAHKIFGNRPAFSNLGQTLSFNDLHKYSEHFAAYLQNELHLKKGDRIAIQMPNLLQFPVVLFGALRAGLVVVNTNPLYTPREMKHQFKDSGVKAIVILANFAHQLEEILPDTDIEHVIVTELGDMLNPIKKILINTVVKHVKKMVPAYNLPKAIPFSHTLSQSYTFTPVDITPEDLVFLQYTGGTTGVSKGAMLTHRNVISNMEQIRVWMKSLVTQGEEVIITALPLYHIFSLVVNCMTFMAYGAHNILITNPRDIPGFVKELNKWKFSVLTGVNTLFNALINNEGFKNLDFSHLKISVGGGMAVQKSVAEKWHKITGKPLVEGYGLTEASPVVCVNPIDGTDRIGTIGLPVPSTEIKLIDEDGNAVSGDTPGELCCRGPQVMKGYWQRPEETKKVISPDGWLRTGDIAILETDGFLRIVDRKKDMILVSGFNVFPNEIEDVVSTHEKVLEVAAVGVPHEKSGEVVKIFVVKKEESLTEQELLDFCRKNLVAYKIPNSVEFRKELPKTNVGKILRRELKEPTS